jgi:hypothetical protein
MKLEFIKDPKKDCKHVVRFICKTPDSPMDSIYVSKAFTDGTVPLIVTVEKAK